MNRLVKRDLKVMMMFGSHVYGTNVPTSDHDYKGLFYPTSKDILMGTGPKTSINQNTKTDNNAKNSKDDIDMEIFTLHGFIKLASEGQTVAMDMLFTPEKFHTQTSEVWKFIQKNSDKLVTAQATSFVGYCFRQAAKYGLKGSRIDAAELVRNFLKGKTPHSILEDHLDEIEAIVAAHKKMVDDGIIQSKEPIIQWTVIEGPRGPERYLEVCSRKFGLRETVVRSVQLLDKILATYGERALAAQKNEGVDWKALMHAVRVCHEAMELLTSGFITFPRPEAPLLLQIRKGELTYQEVSEKIEELLVQVRDAESRSTLPIKFDQQFWEDYILSEYGRKVHDDYVFGGF